MGVPIGRTDVHLDKVFDRFFPERVFYTNIKFYLCTIIGDIIIKNLYLCLKFFLVFIW